MELAFTGSFALAAWQVLGRLRKHAAKIEENVNDGLLLDQWEDECKALVAQKRRSVAAMGKGAAASGHEHIWDDWNKKKLKPAQKIQLVTDVADLAQWAGGGSWVPELKSEGPLKPWSKYGTKGKVHLLQAADALQFNFGEAARAQAELLAGNWLWQVTEALPAISAEPIRATAPLAPLADLKTRLSTADAAVRAAYDSERRSQAAGLKGLVEPLAVAACARRMQVLRVLLDEVGLTPANAAAAVQSIRTELTSPPLTLTPAEAAVAEQKAAAAAAVGAEAEAAVAEERGARMAEIEEAAARTYRRALTLQASSPSHWHASSDTPALHRLGLLAALLGELVACDAAAGAGGGAGAAAADMADSVRKLTPQLRIKLSEAEVARRTELLQALTPAPPAPAEAEAPAAVEAEAPAAPVAEAPAAEETSPDVAAATDGDGAEATTNTAAAEAEEAEEAAEAETSEEAEAAKEEEVQVEEEEAPPAPPARPTPSAAASELRALLEAAIRAQLAAAREERRAARAAARAEEKAAAKVKAEAEQAKAAAAAAAEEEEEQAKVPEQAEEEAEKAEVEAPVAAAAAAAVEEKQQEEGELVSVSLEVVQAGVTVGLTVTEEGGVAVSIKVSESVILRIAVEEKQQQQQEVVKAVEPEEAVTAAAAAAAQEEEEEEEEEQQKAAVAEASSDESLAQEAPPSAPEAEAEEEKAEEPEEQQQQQQQQEGEEAEEEEPPTAEEAVDVEAVKSSVEAEARARAEAEKEAAVMKLQDALEALRASVADKATKELIARVNAATAATEAGADGAPDAGARLLALEAQLRAAGAAEANALARAAADAAARLTAADLASLDGSSAAAVARVATAAARVQLTGDALKLEMGPGCCEVLRRLDGWLDEQLKAAADAAEAAAAAAAAAAAEAEAEATAAEAAEGDEAAADPSGDEQPKPQPQQPVQPQQPQPKPERLVEGRRLVSELLSEGLVLLELPGPSYRKLQILRESVDALDPVGGDGAVQHRLLGTLQELVGQLGPIGASVDARLSKAVATGSSSNSSSSDAAVQSALGGAGEEREKLLAVRNTALAIYQALTAFLKTETRSWEAAKEDLAKVKEAVYGIKIERRAATLDSGISGCRGVAERCAALAGGLFGLGAGSEEVKAAVREAAGALQATAEKAQTLHSRLSEYISFVRLREHALALPASAPADAEDDYELSMPTLEEMMARHGGSGSSSGEEGEEGQEEAEGQLSWLDLAGLGLPPPPEQPEEEEEEVDEETKAAQEAHDQALSQLQERLDGWHAAGLRLLARGRAALVTLGGASLESGELALSADPGLPSAKSLLQLTAERLARLQLLAAESVSGANSGVENLLQWYILVPPAASEPLSAFLSDNNHFGLQAGQVHVCINDVRPPLLTEDMRVVLEAGGARVARSQPGSGEVFLALRRSGALAHMRRAGVSCLEVAAVEDNLPARPLDPGFLGACTAAGVDCAAKVAVPGVQTEGPSALPEVYSRYLGLLGTSSHLLPALADAVPAIGTYYFTMSYVRKVDELLKKQPLALYRLAPAEKVPPVTRGSAAVPAAAAAKAGTAGAAAAAATTAGAAGYRLERRLSDFASPVMRAYLGCEVRLALAAVDVGSEFSPVWGAAPFYRTASPQAAVDALLLQHTRWVEENGGAVGDEDGVVEVGPLVSYGGEGLAPIVEGKTYDEAYVLELQGFSAQSSGTSSNLGLWALPAVALSAGVTALRLLGGAAGAAGRK
ncbi:hypothetical protein Agub_g7805 [Astrephomene gubernaculifera]|uniref:Uncharacterized protein n=1 Tax=Astrephomene gubernaculifera TaxID=47775 RepID=A0AAD3DSA9_9CHLO|nr:hypothetical protein Agub_g7805 [Astrephomene gubernaculifera]